MQNQNTTSENKVLVVGGYGEVGQHVVRTLAAMGENVLIAGRSLDKAQTFRNALAEYKNVGVRVLDLSASEDILAEALHDIKVVVMCTDQSATNFVKLCLKKGLKYLDITADDDFFRRIEALNPFAQEHQATAVLSVGIAPGLTNLLAKEILKETPTTDQIEIGILLGLGDSHGTQAVEWTVRNVLGDKTNNANRVIDYGAPWGQRRSYAFDFSDQHCLRRTTGISNVSTYLALSSKMMTYSTFLLRKPLLKKWASKNTGLLSKLSGISMGSDDGYAIQVQGFTNGKPGKRKVIKGRVEALVTGVVAASVATKLVHTATPAGVLHIHQAFELEDVWLNVRRYAQAQLE